MGVNPRWVPNGFQPEIRVERSPVAVHRLLRRISLFLQMFSGFNHLRLSHYKFTRYERDTETGLDYAMGRYYDSTQGRLMSADPVGGAIADPQSLNRYPYAFNNPSNYTDPTGLDDCSENPLCFVVLGGIFGLGSGGDFGNSPGGFPGDGGPVSLGWLDL